MVGDKLPAITVKAYTTDTAGAYVEVSGAITYTAAEWFNVDTLEKVENIDQDMKSGKKLGIRLVGLQATSEYTVDASSACVLIAQAANTPATKWTTNGPTYKFYTLVGADYQ